MESPNQSELARRIAELSVEQWGSERATVIIGRDPALLDAQYKLLQFAQADSPVLITGETGTGKELFARAVYLLCARRGRPFLCVNCAQFHDSQLLVSELFGHRKGSFTGAHEDRRGVFEEAERGVVLLDEIGELAPAAQAMLLRTLSEGEVLRIGESRPRRVDVRIVAATGRDLRAMIARGAFREDLFYRLRFLRLRIPPLRDRGDDWRLAAEYYLHRFAGARGVTKQLSPSSVALLRDYRWPGNLRELKSVVDMGFHMSGGAFIDPEHFASELEGCQPHTGDDDGADRVLRSDHYARMVLGGECFWEVVQKPFMARDLNRAEVRALIARGLSESQHSYRRLLDLFHVASEEYLKFMDFLRHHRLKPQDAGRRGATAPSMPADLESRDRDLSALTVNRTP